jgi:hypothetical protein
MARQQNKTIKVPDSSGHKTRDVVLASSGRLIPKARDLGRGGGPAVPHIDFHRLRNQPGAQLGVKRIHPVSVHPGCIDTDKKIRNRKQRKKMSKATSTQSADGGNHTVLGTKIKIYNGRKPIAQRSIQNPSLALCWPQPDSHVRSRRRRHVCGIGRVVVVGRDARAAQRERRDGQGSSCTHFVVEFGMSSRKKKNQKGRIEHGKNFRR